MYMANEIEPLQNKTGPLTNDSYSSNSISYSISYSMRTLRINLCQALNRAEAGEGVYIQRRDKVFVLREVSTQEKVDEKKP